MPTSNWTAPTSFPNISTAKWLSLDTETCDPHLKTNGPGFIRGAAFVAGVAIHTDGFSGYYPVRHGPGGNLAPNAVFEWLADEAKHFEGELYGANLLYDLEGLYVEGVKFNKSCKMYDVQVAEPLIEEETSRGYSLEVLSNKYLRVGKEETVLREAAERFTKGYKDRKGRRPIQFDPKADLWMLSPEFVGAYAESDVDRPRRIFQDHQSKILDEEDLWPIFKLESSLIPILLQMRINGVAVDLEQAEKLQKYMTREIDRYSQEIKQLVGYEPNVDSSQDMFEAYQRLNMKMPELNIANRFKHTEKGAPSFTSDWYAAQRDPMSRLVLRKKKLMTMRDDFIVGDILKEQVNGRIHAQFHQLRGDEHGTRTGRFSSTNPNLQQVPNRHDGCDSDCPDDCAQHTWGKTDPVWSNEVRKLFIPDKGKQFFRGDYSQQEIRLAVHFAALCRPRLAGIEATVAAFRENPLIDYHTLTTNIVNEKSGRHFKRKQIKSVTLGKLYSMGLMKLCKQLGLSIAEGTEVVKAYDASLPFVKGLSNKAMNTAEERGFVKTILGRHGRFNLWEPVRKDETRASRGLPRDLAEQTWPGEPLKRFATHKALNKVIQGSAADQTKQAMRVLFYEHNIIPQLIVHDEACGSVSDMEEARIYKRVMEECILLEIPVVCDAGIGPSWGSTKEQVQYV